MRRWCRVRREPGFGSLVCVDERCLPVGFLRRRIDRAGFEDDESDIRSSSASDDRNPAERVDGCGKQNVGSVGSDTGRDGLDERLRCWNVGEMGDDCGVLRRRKVEMGVFAMRSASSVGFCPRFDALVSPTADERRPTGRGGDHSRGDEDPACSR